MKKKNCLYISFLLFVALVIFVWVVSMDFPQMGLAFGFGPAFYPRIVCVGILICVLIIFIQTLFDKKMDKEKIEIKWADFKRLFALLGAAVIYTVTLRYLGFLAVNMAFLLFCLKYYENKWIVTILSSSLVTAVLYITFRIVLRVPLPAGTIFGA